MDSVRGAVIDKADPDEVVARTDTVSDGEAFANKLSRAILIALAVAVGIATFAGAGLGVDDQSTASTEESARLGGDFAAFYAAGSIVWDGDVDSLYDPARQEVAQEALGLDGYLAFAYPPHVAAAYAPLGALNFRLAYFLHTAFMAAVFVAAVVALSKPVPLIARYRWPILAAGLTFFPLATAVGGGQNAALTVLGFAVVWRALHDDMQWLAGVAAGLMMFRPQYALPIVGLMFLARQWRAVAWAGAVAILTWSATAAFLGLDWLANWWAEVVPFVERDAEVNAANSISILGFLQAAWSAEARPAVIIGAIGAAVVVLTLMYLWSNPTRFELSHRMGATAIGVTLISPHTMFYDASLLVIAGAALCATATVNHTPARVIALFWAASLVHLSAGGIGATPLAIVVMGAFVAMVIHTIRWPLVGPELATEGIR